MSNAYRKDSNLSDKKKLLLERLIQKEAAARLSQQSSTHAGSRPAILPRPDRANHPLSLQQQSSWFCEQLVPGEHLLSILDFKGPLDLAVLRQSLQILIDRHDILRAVFSNLDGVPVQTILPAHSADFSLTDLSHLEADAVQRTLADYFDPQRQHPFDLAHGPLYRCNLVQLTSTEHLLMISLHPLLADHATLILLCHELAVLYGKLLTGQDASLPKISLCYADYASWQQQSLREGAFQEHQNYWKRQLAGSSLSLNLPFDHPCAPRTTPRHASSLQELEPALISQARDFCQKENLPLPHLLFAIFALLLYRYTSQADIVSGFLNSNRSSELEFLAGPFATTLPIRVQIAEELTGQQFSHQIHRTLLEASWHQDLPLEHIVEAVYPQHDLTRDPLFQTSLTFHQLPSFAGLSAHLQPLMPTRAAQDLACVFQSSAHQCLFTVTYDSNLFDAVSIERFQKHYGQVLHAFLHQPTRTLSTFSCLSSEEQVQWSHRWNTTTLAEPLAHDLCIQHLFEQQVQRTPQAVAISDGQRQLTYQELNLQANQLAHLLRHRGIGPEHRVGLCLPRSLDLVVGLLAILKAGAAYIPLDPAYPVERLAFMLQDAQPTLVLTQQELANRVPFSSAPVLYLDTPELTGQESTENHSFKMSNEHLAYVIYTSGSTGLPKGVCICHKSVVIFLRWARQHFSDEDLAGVLAGTSICFDLSIFELFAPLSWGGKAILAPSVLDFPRLAQAEHITLLNTVPSAATTLLNNGDLLSTSLLTINLAGEALTRDLVQALYRQTEVQRVWNLYGPTEDTTYSTWEITNAEEEGVVSIGCPLTCTQAYIVDAQLQPVPIGVVGELYLGGDGQARGYLNRPDLTAERFVPDPFSRTPGRRLYKTGDLARYRADGRIDYLGRLDHQVKIRGFRIELGEIEAFLRQHPAVADVVVVAVEHIPGEKQLAAYIVTQPPHRYDPSLLRQYLQNLIPAYMVPAFIIPLARLPQTVNGKVNRRELPGVGSSPVPAPQSPLDLPQGKREHQLSLLWREILRVPAVERNDNFFFCGGDSLLAMRLLARIQRDFGSSLALEDIFATPTFAQLADKLQAVPTGPGSETIPPLQRRTPLSETPLPLSFAQQRLWFVDQLGNEPALYNVPLILSLTGTLNRLALYQALQEIIRRHSILRTTIYSIKGSPFQSISDLSTPATSFIDLMIFEETQEGSSKENLYTHPRVIAEMQKEVARPFDLSTGPLLRIRLLRVQTDQHILMLTMHHTITDGWSLSLLVEELNTLYNAFTAGHPSPLPALSIQYGDFVVWQREHQAAHFTEDLEYWKKRFSLLPPSLALPLDYPRPAVQTFAGDSLRFQISSSLTQQLLALSLQEGVTLFMTLLSAFLVLLARYCGQEDLVVGTVVANRFRPELEALIGFFANTLALRADVSNNPTVRELLQRVSTIALEAYRHQDTPFEQVVDAVVAPSQRDPARSPLFQVLFLLQNMPATTLDLQHLRVQTIEVTLPVSQFDLSFLLEEISAGLRLTIEYNTQLFAPATIERLQAHYHTLLLAFCAQPDRRIQEIPLLSEAEQNHLLGNWYVYKTPFRAARCLHELFAEQVERTPAAIAVQEGERSLSYQELNWRGNQLAHELRSLGVGPDTLVGLCLDRSVEQIVGLLAILKAGGAYIPLDPLLPPERLEYILADAQMKLVLTQQDYLDRINSRGRDLLCLDITAELYGEQRYMDLPGGVNPLNLAYVIYTSGSTGRPKGVMISHQGLENLVRSQIDILGVRPTSRVLQFASLSFDASVSEIFMALCTGATLCLETKDALLPGAELIGLIGQRAITIVTLPPSVLHALSDGDMPTVETIVSAGEICPAETATHWARERAFFNAYGPTEVTVCATMGKYTDPGLKPTIGYPIKNTRIYVLDKYLSPVPIGVVGEIFIGGPGLGRGYLGRADLTAEAFVPDPFATIPGERLYRTGDLARYLSDGTLDFISRADYQIKLRGFRIELGEIEHALCDQPAIHQAVVLLREDQPGLSQLVAYVQPVAGHVVNKDLLRLALKERLPSYMIPAIIVSLETLPLTLSGKIDRKQLPAPDKLQLVERPLNDMPQGPLEEALTHIWQRILRLPAVGRTDNFFELGGHSLLAMQVVVAIREELQVPLLIRQFFAVPTIVELAAFMERKHLTAPDQPETRRDTLPPLLPVARTGEFPLSFAQQRLWFMDQLEGSSATYNIPVALQIIGNLDLPVLQHCIREIVRRHESLRTTFPKGQDSPIQCIHMLPLAPVEVVEFSPGENSDLVLQVIQTEVQLPFDLATGPLLRIRVLRLSQQKHILIFVMHHIISDGWSMGVLAQELSLLYNAFCAGKPSPLPELPIQYVDFVAWQRSYLQGSRLTAQLAYWKQHLTGASPLNLPIDHPRAVTYSMPGATSSVQWPQSLTQKLLTFSQQENVTLFMTLLTGLLMLLGYSSGQEDITIGTPIANRSHPALEALVGLFVNTLALRTSLAGNPIGRELLQRVRDVMLSGYEHQDVPFEQVVEAVPFQRQPGISPLFQTLFVLQNTATVDLSLTNLQVKPLDIQSVTAKLDLSVGAEINVEGLSLGMEYNTQLFEQTTIQRLQAQYRVLIEQLVTHPEWTLAGFYEAVSESMHDE